MIKRYVNELIQHEIVDPKEREIVTFGLKQGLFMLINFVTAIIIGGLLSMWWQSVVFLLIYSPLRIFAGGVHAKTPFRCYLASIVLVGLYLLAVQHFPQDIYILLAACAVSSVGIFCLAPVEDKNKPLDDTEVKVYKKRSRIVILVQVCLFALCLAIRAYMLATCIVISLFALLIMLVIGKVKNVYSNLHQNA